MDPEMLRALQAYFLSGSAMNPTYFATGSSPNPDAPELDPWAQNLFATGAPPDVNKYGEMVPYGLDTAKSLLNFQQDMYGSVADPMNAYLASTMGGEGFAPGVFDPITKRTPIELVQTPMLAQMAQTGGVNGILAGFMLGGDDYRSAVAKLRSGLTNPDELGLSDEEVQALTRELPALSGMNNMPLDTTDPNNVDWNALTKEAQGLWQPLAQEQAKLSGPGIESDEMGRYFQTEQVDSPQMEFLQKLGLPDPRAQYDLKYALANDPTVNGLFLQKANSQAGADMMRKTLDQYTKKLAKQREQEAQARKQDADVLAKYQQGPLREWQGKMDVQAGGIRQAMSDYFREAAQAGAPLPYPNQDAVNQRNARMEPFQAQETLTPSFPIPGNGPDGQPYWKGSPSPVPGFEAGPAGPDLPDFSWPGEMPEPPELSLYSRGRGASSDQVASLFNKLTGSLPKTFRPKERAAEQNKLIPLRQNVSKAVQRNVADQNAMFEAMIPYFARQRAGRTPAKDVVQQRLLPLYASGAFGQQGMPGAYPDRNAVTAALFGG